MPGVRPLLPRLQMAAAHSGGAHQNNVVLAVPAAERLYPIKGGRHMYRIIIRDLDDEGDDDE